MFGACLTPVSSRSSIFLFMRKPLVECGAVSFAFFAATQQQKGGSVRFTEGTRFSFPLAFSFARSRFPFSQQRYPSQEPQFASFCSSKACVHKTEGVSRQPAAIFRWCRQTAGSAIGRCLLAPTSSDRYASSFQKSKTLNSVK
jgi:hypothetical protein